MHRLNIAWGCGDIAEQVADVADASSEHPVADMHVRPDGGEQVGFTHQAAGVLHQVAQYRHGFRLQVAPLRTVPQTVVSRSKVEGAKVQDRHNLHQASSKD